MDKSDLSAVIICRNAANTIYACIQSALQVSNDVVVVDNGSTDRTVEIILTTGARLVQTEWLGYGNTKNVVNALAKNDWILSLDADEYMDDLLIRAIRNYTPAGKTDTASVKRLNYLGAKPIGYGEWGNDNMVRLFNKKNAVWDQSSVHEKLVTKLPGKETKLAGLVHHCTAADINTYKAKLDKYALLMAEKYHASGKQAGWLKRYISPPFGFIKNYLFKGGFLDGKEGFQIAAAHFRYNYQKYNYLKTRQASPV